MKTANAASADNMQKTGIAHGKIILSGEYAVVFGKRGIAIPSKEKISVRWDDNPKNIEILWKADEQWIDYVKKILNILNIRTGILTIDCELPLGKGMGSSTALVIALAKCFLGDNCKEKALAIENEVNSGNSGIDFAVIWANQPVLFQKDIVPELITLPDVLSETRLIDTGMPSETTEELVAWMKTQYAESKNSGAGFLPAYQSVQASIETIGQCTERLLKGEPIKNIIKDHHRAQVALGVVPESVQKLIADIESKGGAAKVIGAGARTGGGGMVLVFP
jgi:mevalonate kinase